MFRRFVVPRGGALACPLEVYDRLGGQRLALLRSQVASQAGGALEVESDELVRRLALFEEACKALVELGAAQDGCRLIDGVTEERMGEAVWSGDLFEDARERRGDADVGRAVGPSCDHEVAVHEESDGRCRGRGLGCERGHADVPEFTAHHGASLGDRSLLLREARDACLQHGFEPCRQPCRVTAFGDVMGELADHQGISLCHREQPVAIHSRDVGCKTAQEISRLVVSEWPKLEAQVGRLAAECRDDVCRLGSRRRDGRDAGDTDERAEESDHRGLGPMEVFEDEQEAFAGTESTRQQTRGGGDLVPGCRLVALFDGEPQTFDIRGVDGAFDELFAERAQPVGQGRVRDPLAVGDTASPQHAA